MSTKLVPDSIGLIGPTYVRPATRMGHDLVRTDDTVDYSAGYIPASSAALQQTGLRGKRLWAVIACLCILWILALFAFFCNIFIIAFLGMNHRGMESMQFHTYYDAKTGEPEHVVQFTGDNVDLGTVVTHSGKIGGHKDRELNVEGSRVLLSSNKTKSGKPAQLILQEGRCRIENVDDFLVLEPNTRRPLFSALHPMVQLGKNIKQVATSQIVTNKVRAPVDGHLLFQVGDMSFRGNQGNKFSAKRINITAKSSIDMKTTKDGTVRLTAGRGFYLSEARNLPLSSSPSLSASVDGYRLCACITSNRLFTVPGNKPCDIDSSLCP